MRRRVDLNAKDNIFLMERSNIELRLNDLSLVILPEFGGRIASVKLDGCEEWISQPLAPLIARNVGDDFIRPEISGWDEMVPTTDRCQSLDGLHDLPDHGEVWSRPEPIEHHDRIPNYQHGKNERSRVLVMSSSILRCWCQASANLP